MISPIPNTAITFFWIYFKCQQSYYPWNSFQNKKWCKHLIFSQPCFPVLCVGCCWCYGYLYKLCRSLSVKFREDHGKWNCIMNESSICQHKWQELKMRGSQTFWHRDNLTSRLTRHATHNIKQGMRCWRGLCQA